MLPIIGHIDDLFISISSVITVCVWIDHHILKWLVKKPEEQEDDRESFRFHVTLVIGIVIYVIIWKWLWWE